MLWQRKEQQQHHHHHHNHGKKGLFLSIPSCQQSPTINVSFIEEIKKSYIIWFITVKLQLSISKGRVWVPQLGSDNNMIISLTHQISLNGHLYDSHCNIFTPYYSWHLLNVKNKKKLWFSYSSGLFIHVLGSLGQAFKAFKW